jgi:hypothetical protein
MFPFGLQKSWWPHLKIYLVLTQCRHTFARFGLMGRASVHRDRLASSASLIICLSPALAQSDSSLQGYVKDQTGSVVVGPLFS